VDAVVAINQRISEIQSRIAQLEPPAAPPGAVSVGGTFAAVLGTVTGTASAVGTASVSAPAPVTGDARTTAVGSGRSLVNADNVPLSYVGYGNGRIPSTELSPIDGTSQRLWPPAARSFEAMRAAAAADGVTIGITDSYRSYDAQVDVAARKGLYSQGGLAAVPGTSRHGWGMALDLDLDGTAQAWMREHGGQYGFVENVPRESWHWEYVPTR
jgi:D-alanyl-D-alanine carboxypeptidase